jgi:hypothetical protein
VSEKERLAYADESLLFNTPYLDPGEVAELEVLRPSLAEDVLKSHRSRHGGKQSEVIDSQSLNGLLQDLEKKARERDHAGYWELWDKMPENPEIVVDVRELDGFFVAADALRKTYRIRLRRDMRRTLNGAPFDPDKIVYARWMGLVWNAATSPIEIKERLRARF